MKDGLVIGSRGSKLALTQAEIVKYLLSDLVPTWNIRIEIIKTSGDVKSDPLSLIGGKGVFTKELEDALIDRRIDIAVHSLKDLPTNVPEELSIAAITEREDPRDALVLRSAVQESEVSLQSLAPESVIGTSSPRRLAQLKHTRPDLVFEDVRGNVDTRLRKLDEGQFDALILACAGLRRLRLAKRISVAIPVEQVVPAVGQGALAIQVRKSDGELNALIGKLNHTESMLACTAERALLRVLGGGCQLPIAAHASVSDSELRLQGLVASPDGQKIVKDTIEGSAAEAERLGSQLAQRLQDSGASELLASYNSP